MTETKKILLIGRSGRGKSSLANVLTNRREVKREKTIKELVESGNKCHKCGQEFVERENKDSKWIEAIINEQGSYLFHEECFNFKESSGSASETKKVQFEEFNDPKKEKLNKLLDELSKEEKIASGQINLDKEDLQLLKKTLEESIKNKAKYCVIDTPGIGDTKMSDSEVLDIIAEAVYRTKDGINQVFFVTDGRFDQFEMATYNLLRTIIFDEKIADHTTIIRTRFQEFRNPNKCEEDIKLMTQQKKKWIRREGVN